MGISKAKRDRQRDNRRKGGELLVKIKVSRELSCKTLDNIDTNKYIDNLKSSWDSELIYRATKEDRCQIIDKRKEVPEWGEITTLDLESNEFISIDRAKGKAQGVAGEWTGKWINKEVRLEIR